MRGGCLRVEGRGWETGREWVGGIGRAGQPAVPKVSLSGRSIARPPQEPDMDRDMDRGSVVTGHEGFRDRGGRTGGLSIGTQPRAGNGNDRATDSHHILIQSVR